MKEDRDPLHLERIIEAIDKVKEYVDGFSFEDFVKDEKTYDASLMQIENIGEMIARMSERFKEKYTDLPWHQVIGIRNQIAHGYFDIQPKIIWQTIKEDLPELKSKVEKILE